MDKKLVLRLIVGFLAVMLSSFVYAQTPSGYGYGPAGGLGEMSPNRGYGIPSTASTLGTSSPIRGDIVRMKNPREKIPALGTTGVSVAREQTDMRGKMLLPSSLPGTYEQVPAKQEPRVQMPRTPDRMMAMGSVHGMNLEELRGMGQSIRDQFASTRTSTFSTVRNDLSPVNMVDSSITINPNVSIVNAPQMGNQNEQVINNQFTSSPQIAVDLDAGSGGQVAQSATGGSGSKTLDKAKKKTSTFKSILSDVAESIPVVGGLLKKLF